MQPTFPGDSPSNLNAGWEGGTTYERMRAHQRAQRAIGSWPAATLTPAAAIDSALRQIMPIGPGVAADALRALYEAS